MAPVHVATDVPTHPAPTKAAGGATPPSNHGSSAKPTQASSHAAKTSTVALPTANPSPTTAAVVANNTKLTLSVKSGVTAPGAPVTLQAQVTLLAGQPASSLKVRQGLPAGSATGLYAAPTQPVLDHIPIRVTHPFRVCGGRHGHL